MQFIKKIPKLTLALILAGVLALLVGAYFLIGALAPEPPPPPKEELRYEPIAGEDQTTNLVYPAVKYEGSTKNAETLDICVSSEQGTYGIFKAAGDSTFYFYYLDEENERQIYFPPIASSDPKFDYTTLYATEDMGLGVGLPRVMYFALAAGTIYFNERIELQADEAARQSQLQAYGLWNSKNRVTLYFADESGVQQGHTLVIGDKLVANNGYYLMVDNRPYVYASSTDTLGYLLQPLSYYINPVLVSPGTTNSQYSQYEGFITVSFREFVNKVHTDPTLSIPAGATVIVNGKEKHVDDKTYGPQMPYEFRLSELSGNASYSRLVAALTGNRVGEQSLTFTLPLEVTESRQLFFGELSSQTYHYTILRVDALLRETAEVTSGTVGDDTRLKITYALKKNDGTTQTTMQGILDLGSAGLSDADAAKLSALPVGRDLSADEQVTLDIIYTEETSEQKMLHMVVDDILAVYDRDGNPISAATEDSVISCRYHYIINGEATSPIISTLDLKAASGEYGDSLRDKLVGKGVVDGLNLTVYTYVEQYEIMMGFVEYTIDEITSFVTEEEIVAFGFENAADRDPFHRETYFTNKLPSTNKYSIYGLNDSSCQRVIRQLGGMQSNANTAAGLFGTETVAVGLTTEVMQTYDLYDNRIYLEVPRGITTVTNANKETEFRWLYTLGFTMYISDTKYDPDTGETYRYVGCDLYDVVVRIDNETFDFLDHSFVDYWARDIMVLVDMDDVDFIRMETFLDDFKGSYEFQIERLSVPQQNGSTYIWSRLNVLVGGDCNLASLLSFMERHQTGSLVNLNEIYDDAMGIDGATYEKHYAGDGYFREWLETLYYIGYSGTLAEDEQRDFLEGELLVRMTFALEVKANSYVFEFYRGSDRRVMVRLYQVNDAGVVQGEAVQDFYISSFAFKQMLYGTKDLLCGQPIDGDNEYGE